MNRSMRQYLPASLLLLAVACTDRDPTALARHGGPLFDVTSPGFTFLPPLGTAAGSSAYVGTLAPEVLVCRWTGTDCLAGSLLAQFSTAGGTGGAAVVVAGDDSYRVNWQTGMVEAGAVAVAGETYHVVVRLGGEFVGSTAILLVDNAGQARGAPAGVHTVVRGSTLPIRFGIAAHALFTLLGVDPGDIASNDFVITTFSTTEDGQTAAVPSGEAAFTVDGADIQIPGGGSTFTLVIYEKALSPGGECEPTYNGPNRGGCFVFGTIPAGVTFLDDAENPAGIAGVCPDAGVTGAYRLAKYDDGVTTFPDPSPIDVVNCAGLAMRRLPRLLRGLARLVLPGPLHADDEGESGMVGAFSTLFWAVPLALEENPAAPLPTGVLLPAQTLPLSFRVMTTHTHSAEPDSLPVSDVRVHFGIGSGAGLISADSAVSDGDGVVTVNWQLPPAAGLYTLTAQIADASAPGSTFAVTADVQTGLLLHYTFDGHVQNSGLLTGFDGVATGVTFEPGKFGQAVKLDGTPASGVLFAGTNAIFAAGGTKWTISLWYREPPPAQTFAGIWSFRAATAGWESYKGNATTNITTCATASCIGFTIVADTLWHNLIYRYDAASPTSGAPVAIFRDGMFVAQIPSALVNGNVADIRLGAPFPSSFYLDDFRVYNAVFTPAQQCTLIIGGTMSGPTCILP